MKEIPSLKDNEFLKEYGKLKIGSEAKEFLMEKFKKDINVSIVVTVLYTYSA